MILVDSSVLIDVLNSRETLQTRRLEELSLDEQDIAVGDLMIVEVLQGTRTGNAFEEARAFLSEFSQLRISDVPVAEQGARNYRALRQRGITIRKTIDTLIATRCIMSEVPLLYNDRDFDPFVEHLGLRSAMT
ncbi:PIN domain nuclease [uncultured Sphingomonas sp.]|uniref:type II toxin-antitoxin system VapC family toxin n=1 Tax=uncultured Sphingomonas sp. TaxID=158754 RepID=UPI0030F715F8